MPRQRPVHSDWSKHLSRDPLGPRFLLGFPAPGGSPGLVPYTHGFGGPGPQSLGLGSYPHGFGGPGPHPTRRGPAITSPPTQLSMEELIAQHERVKGERDRAEGARDQARDEAERAGKERGKAGGTGMGVCTCAG